MAIGLFVAFTRAAAGKTGGLQSYGASWLRRSPLWLIVTASVIYGPWAMGAALAGALALGSGFLTAVAGRSLSAPSFITDSPPHVLKLATTAMMRVAAVIFILAIIAFFSSVASWLAAAMPAWLPGQIGLGHLYAALLAVAASAVLAYVVNVNEYSLHGMYKNRLTRGFLRDGIDISLRDLISEQAPGAEEVVVAAESRCSQTKADPKKSLFHIVNATVNTGTRFSFDRMGLPFFFTALHHGYWEDTGAVFADNNSSDLTLGTSMAISGAAANPNMGYFSSALIRFPMALLNLRLGWWLPQPEPSSKPARFSPWTTWGIWKAEFMGISDHKDKLINVSDGGHFDNLGLYEMVRRRCKHVLVIDAGADRRREYQDLANVVRRVRIDFGVEITIDGLDIGEIPADDKSSRLPVYKGTIHYRRNDPKADDGIFVYVRPEPQAEEPTDISAYRARHSDFPHETTADQWFSEAQFESYRRLGQFTIDKAVEFYLSDKEPSANLALLQSADGIVELLAESAYRMSRGVTPSSHAGGILYERLGPDEIRVFLVRSAPNKYWVLPKGHIEQGESQADAAKREVIEETGYRTSSPKPFGIETFERGKETVYTAYFLMDVAGQNPDPDDCFENRPLLRLVFNTKTGRDRNRTDLWRWDRAEWHPAEQPDQQWQEVPDDVQELLERIVRHVSVESASQ